MKKIFLISCLCLALTVGVAAGQENKVIYRETQTEVKALSRIGDIDPGAIAMLKGQWLIADSRFILEFSDLFAGKVDGLKYYHYKRLQTSSRYPYIFTIVKSKTSGKLYFARGYYENGRLYGSTSRIELSQNRLIVYSSTDHKAIYFKAYRLKPKK